MQGCQLLHLDTLFSLSLHAHKISHITKMNIMQVKL